MDRSINKGSPVRRLMSNRPIFIEARASAHLAKHLARSHDVHHLLVTRDGEFVGVTCLCDLEDARETDSVARRMRSPAVCIGENDTCEQAALIMMQCGVGCLPVVSDDGVLRGVITRRDLRRGGSLPGEKGVDRCAHCGSSHRLRPANARTRQVLCFPCSVAMRPSEPASDAGEAANRQLEVLNAAR